ncbi:MAG: hypothetical protein NC235_06340 [Clostridiales bacterium]|nr:hypothetical protein [Clostridiales bacterium]
MESKNEIEVINTTDSLEKVDLSALEEMEEIITPINNGSSDCCKKSW